MQKNKPYQVPNICAPQRLLEAYFTTSIYLLACPVPAKNAFYHLSVAIENCDSKSSFISHAVTAFRPFGGGNNFLGLIYSAYMFVSEYGALSS